MGCGRVFEKGTKMHISVIATESEIYTWRKCPTCEIILTKHKEKFIDAWENGFFPYCVSDALNKDETPEQLLIRLDNELNKRKQ